MNPDGFQSLFHSMYDDYFVVIKIFDFDFPIQDVGPLSAMGDAIMASTP